MIAYWVADIPNVFETAQSNTHRGLTPPARGMAKQLTPTARPAAGPQHVQADSKCVLLPVGAVVV